MIDHTQDTSLLQPILHYLACENTPMTKKANVLLVHGAWADGSCWSKVILILQSKGIVVTAAQIPLTSLSDDIAVTQRLLSMQREPTVLVGHSYGGAVITGAAGTGAAGNMSHVKALVYITAFGLDEGESLQSLSQQGPPSSGSAAIEPDSLGYLWINRRKFHQSFVGDATADEAAIMAAVQKPLSIASFTEKEGTPAWKHIPSWYLLCTDDQMIPPPAQEFLAKRMKATTRSVASSHAAFMAHPQEVANLIIEAVESVSRLSADAA
jgi:pimeloyl-ACP methyl ester carboxylesterase